MRQIYHFLSVQRHKILGVLCFLILSSCASDRARYEPAPIAYAVQTVSVVSADPSTDHFARSLHLHLQNSVGRPQGSPGKAVDLMVQTLPTGLLEQSTRSLLSKVSSLGATSISASVRLIDHQTQLPLGYKQIVASSTSDDPQIANSKIMEDMVSQIRAMLGIGISAPRPVAKRTSAGINRVGMNGGFVPSSAYSNDPLLNGTYQSSDTDESLIRRIREIDNVMTMDAQEMRQFVESERRAMQRTQASTNNPAPTPQAPSGSEPVVEEQMSMAPPTNAPTIPDVVQAAMRSDDGLDLMAQETASEMEELLSNPTLVEEDELCIVTADNDCLGS